MSAFRMGTMMTLSLELARMRAIAYSNAMMKRRRPLARRARWNNSYANFKKLVGKHRTYIAIVCISICLTGGFIAAYANDLFKPLRMPVASDLSPPILASEPVGSLTTEIQSTPVAASGDETFPGLKLTTKLSSINSSKGNKP